MYCSDEATIWMSSSAMKPPKHITTNGPRLLSQLAVSGIAVTSRLARPAGYRRSRSSKGPDVFRRGSRRRHRRDADRYALNDLREVAGSVFRRDHEDRSP